MASDTVVDDDRSRGSDRDGDLLARVEQIVNGVLDEWDQFISRAEVAEEIARQVVAELAALVEAEKGHVGRAPAGGPTP